MFNVSEGLLILKIIGEKLTVFNIGDGLKAFEINDWLLDSAFSIVRFFIALIGEAMANAGKTIPVIKDWYNLFVGICSLLLVCVIVFRVLMTTIREGDGSTEASASTIIIDSTKACGAIPVMMFIQGYLYNKIILPVLSYFILEQVGYVGFTVKSIERLKNYVIFPDLQVKITTFVFVVLVIFFAIVLVAFFVKMSIYLAQLAFFTLSIPFCAISIASEQFEYASMWWKKLLFLNISIVAQVISLTLMIYAFSEITKSEEGAILYFMLTIGAGVLIFKAPLVIEDLWTSTGTAKSGGRLLSTGAKLALRRMILKG